MLSKEEAINATEFHEDAEPGGHVYKWKRTGETKVSVSNPEVWEIPVQEMHVTGTGAKRVITQLHGLHFHTPDNCMK